MKTLHFFLLSGLFFLVTCTQKQLPKSFEELWFKGSVEKAFAESKKDQRLMFLYWGAVWCPPCNQLKKTVFSKDEFKRELLNFIPVYLDGDQKEAQVWGEKLRSSGYPTILILNHLGEEITRMSSSLSVQDFVSHMKKARSLKRPLVKLASSQDFNFSKDQWRLLAGHSWGQESAQISDETFNKLYHNAPSSLPNVKSRFFLLSLHKKVKTDQGPLDKKERKELIKILQDPHLVKYNKDFLYYSFFSFLKKEKSDQLEKLWLKAMSKLRGLALSSDDILSSYIPQVLVEGEGEKFSDELLKNIREAVKSVDEKTSDLYERQASMSSAVWLLKKTKQYDLAKLYAQSELKKTKSPFYFMSYLASIEKDLGNTDKALEWKKLAWEKSTGGATRFQWGSGYLLSLLDQKELDESKKVFKALFSEVVGKAGAFSGRNRARVERIVKSLHKDEKLTNLRGELSTILNNLCKVAENNSECSKWAGKIKVGL